MFLIHFQNGFVLQCGEYPTKDCKLRRKVVKLGLGDEIRRALTSPTNYSGFTPKVKLSMDTLLQRETSEAEMVSGG